MGKSSRGLQSIASEDWETFQQVFSIPLGIIDFSPGLRSDGDYHPGYRLAVNLHPERRARKDGRAADRHTFCDPLPGSNPSTHMVPRVLVADASRPGAKICDPIRDQETKCGGRMVRGIGLQCHSGQCYSGQSLELNIVYKPLAQRLPAGDLRRWFAGQLGHPDVREISGSRSARRGPLRTFRETPASRLPPHRHARGWLLQACARDCRGDMPRRR